MSFAERAIPVKHSDEDLGRKATTALAWAIGTFAVGAFIYTVASILRLYTPIMFWDHWLVLDYLRPGQFTLAHLWSLHNDHRYFIGRLLSLADVVLFRGQSVSLYLEIFAIQAVHLLIFAWIVRRFTHFSRPVFVSVLAFLLYCMFSPLQLENFVTPFQAGFVLAGCAASACFLLASWYATIPAGAVRRRRLAFCGCIFLAWVAEASLANGLLVWPLLLFMAFALGFRKRDILIVLGMGVLAIALYIPGYHMAPGPARPLDVLKFVVTYLASSWDPSAPNPSNFPNIAESATLLAIGVVLAGSASCLRNWKKPNPLRAFLYADMLFVLGAATLTALGRLNFGYAEAVSSRYQEFALAFWASLAILGATYLTEMSAGWRAMAAAQIVVLAFLLGTPYRYSGIEQSFANRKAALYAGYEDLALGHLDSPAIKKLFPLPQQLPGYLAILREYNAEPRLGIPELLPADMNMDSYRIARSGACQGYMEHAAWDPRSSGYGVAGGWAWDNADHRPAQRAIVAVVATGKIVGWNWPLVSRPDVEQIPGIKSKMTGWNVSFHADGPGPYAVYALLGHDRLACPIGKPFTLPQAPQQ